MLVYVLMVVFVIREKFYGFLDNLAIYVATEGASFFQGGYPAVCNLSQKAKKSTTKYQKDNLQQEKIVI